MLVDPKSVKKIGNLIVILTHLGFEHLKAVRKTLMKLTPGLQAPNIKDVDSIEINDSYE